jgi:hypothetical protein
MTRDQQLEAFFRHIQEGCDMACRSASKVSLLTTVSRDLFHPRRMRETARELRELADILDEKSEEMVS